MRGFKTGHVLILQNCEVFLCKNVVDIIIGPQRTVQNKKTKAVHDPFNILYLI